MSITPCKDCEARYPGCHGKCKDYITWRAEYDKDKEQKRIQKEIEAEQSRRVFGTRKRAGRWKK